MSEKPITVVQWEDDKEYDRITSFFQNYKKPLNISKLREWIRLIVLNEMISKNLNSNILTEKMENIKILEKRSKDIKKWFVFVGIILFVMIIINIIQIYRINNQKVYKEDILGFIYGCESLGGTPIEDKGVICEMLNQSINRLKLDIFCRQNAMIISEIDNKLRCGG